MAFIRPVGNNRIAVKVERIGGDSVKYRVTDESA